MSNGDLNWIANYILRHRRRRPAQPHSLEPSASHPALRADRPHREPQPGRAHAELLAHRGHGCVSAPNW